ncbi:LTA synthase family protein [Bacillaceae bacterium Marseille-Q3522]|nr:LTA synthase family protein [Bacillaceae bacterium Marseille-Q3522]
MKRLFTKPLHFFFLAVLFLWGKSYFAYKVEFHLDLDNFLQQFLLFINPVSSAIIFLGLAFFSKRRELWMIIISTFMTLILYANVVYYRFFNDFLTLPTILQSSTNVGNLGGSAVELLRWHDFIYFIDLFLLLFIWLSKKIPVTKTRITKKSAFSIVSIGALVFAVNLSLAEIDRPELLTRTFDRNYIIKYLGAYNYTVYDALLTAQTTQQRALASSDDLTEVINFRNSHYAEPNDEYFAKAKGMNIIKIHLESLQSFLIDYKLNGEEVTPFLNSLAHNDDYMYFDNFFHQTGQGKTSDAELMLDTSLYGLPQGSAFVTKGTNTYQAAPAILNQRAGYTSAVLHGDYKTFWNRNEIYKQFGIDTFFDASYYNMAETEVINYGLKDKAFFNESIPMLETLPQPFYAHLMTLTNHFPFLIDEDEASIEPAATGDASVDRYFQTARYMDEALQQFFEDLKASGLYDNSLILLYGDHYGISANHNNAMEQIMGEEITPLKNAQLQRVPLLIHVPGVKGGVMHQYGGEIDVLPTLLHLVGIGSKEFIQFGTDLLSPEHDEVVAFRNGDFVSPLYSSIDGKYYNTKTEELLEETAEMETDSTRVATELRLSDQVLYGDLLRFHQLKDWTPVDPANYMYGKDQ